MADLSDDEIIDMAVDHNLGRTMSPIGMQTGDVFVTDTAYRTGELLNCVRAAIAADRALNAAHSVGAEGLPPLPSPWDVCYLWREPTGLHRSFSANHYNGRPCDDQVLLYTAAEVREYGDSRERAALASRPAVDADKRDAERRYRAALLWALGCTPCEGEPFRAAKEGEGPYYWRHELTKRAGLVWDRESLTFVDAARHPAQREGE